MKKIKKTFVVICFLLSLMCGIMLMFNTNKIQANADELVFANAKAVVASIDNTSGEELSFTVTITDTADSTNVWTANDSGSVLLLNPSDDITTWTKQIIPAGFVGEVYVPFYYGYKTAGEFMNKVFSGVSGKSWPTNATVVFDSDLFTDIHLIDNATATSYEAKTIVTSEMVKNDGKFFEQIVDLNATTNDTMAYFETNADWGRVQLENLEGSTANTYGVAIRVKNLSAIEYPMQFMLFSSGGSKISTQCKLATKKTFNAETEQLYMLYVGKDGTTQKLTTFIGTTSGDNYNQYFNIPANADGALVIPWTEIMYYNTDKGDYNGVPFDPTVIDFVYNKNLDGMVAFGDIGYLGESEFVTAGNFKTNSTLWIKSGSRKSIDAYTLNVTNAQGTQSSFYTVKVNGNESTTAYTFDNVKIAPAESYRIISIKINGVSVQLKEGEYTAVMSGEEKTLNIEITAEQVPNLEQTLTVSSAEGVNTSSYSVVINESVLSASTVVYVGDVLKFVPSDNYNITNVSINGINLVKDVNDKFSYTVTVETESLQAVITTELILPNGKKFAVDSSFISENVVPLASLKAVAFDIDNTLGGELTLKATIIDADSYDYWTNSGNEKIVLMYESGKTIYTNAKIPAGYKGLVVLSMSGVKENYIKNTFENPTFISETSTVFPNSIIPDIFVQLFDEQETSVSEDIISSMQCVANWEVVTNSANDTVKNMLEQDTATHTALDALNNQEKADMSVITFSAVDSTSSLGYFKVNIKNYVSEDIYKMSKNPVALVMRASVLGSNDWFYLQPVITDDNGSSYTFRGNLGGWYMYGQDGNITDIYLHNNSQYITIKGDGVLVLPLANLCNYNGGSANGIWDSVATFESWLLNKDDWNKNTILALGQFGVLMEDGSVHNLFDFGDIESDIMSHVEKKNSVVISSITSTTVSIIVNEDESDESATLSVSERAYLGDIIEVIAVSGKKVKYVTVNGVFVEPNSDGKYMYGVNNTSEELVFEVITEDIPVDSNPTENPTQSGDVVIPPKDTDQNTNNGCGSRIDINIGAVGLIVIAVFVLLKKKQKGN